MPGYIGAIAAAHRAPELLRPDLGKGHDEMVGADIGLVLVERPDPHITVPVIGDVDFEQRRPAANKRSLNRDAGPGGIRGDRSM
jgi:hypothetical protein